MGVEGSYERFEISEATFPNFIEQAMDESWTGFSLTMPLKEAAFSSSFPCDERTERIHSANTLIHNGRTFVATSTDILAFDRLLAQVTFSRVAIIGSGGTARAAIGALSNLTDEVTVIQRSDRRNELTLKAAGGAKVNFSAMDTRIESFDLVISTTPAGASDQLAESLLQAHGDGGGTLIEALYKPSPTELSKTWKKRGGVVFDGLDLLAEQALDQIRLMTSLSFDYTSMRTALLGELRSTSH